MSERQFKTDPDLLVDLFTKNNVVQPVSEDGRKSNSKPDIHLLSTLPFHFLHSLMGTLLLQGSATASAEATSSVDKPIEVDELLDDNLDPNQTKGNLSTWSH
jgi:heat shock transcription factor 2